MSTESNPHMKTEAKVETPVKAIPAKTSSIIEDCATLSAKLDALASAFPQEAVPALWKSMDALYARDVKTTIEEHHHIAALSARFHHFIPRESATA